MKHYLNVCDVKGNLVEPVDVITFGSPCQDMSNAGKRKGMKMVCLDCEHEFDILKDLKDGEEASCPKCGSLNVKLTRSGLFMEAVRIIKEMQMEDIKNGRTGEDIRPRYAVWENVPGAFTSNKGEDFKRVLEELARVSEPEVSIPRLLDRKGKIRWRPAGYIRGDNWSIAWRTLDAQYWGVPQRRRRIFLVADFRGHSAGQVLFEQHSLFRNFAQGRKEGQEVTGDVARSSEGAGEPILVLATQQGGAELGKDLCPTITAAAGMSGNNQPVVCIKTALGSSVVLDDQGGSCINFNEKGIIPTLRAEAHGNLPCVCFEPGALKRLGDASRYSETCAPTLRAEMGDNQLAIAYGVVSKGNGEAFLIKEKHMSLACGGGQAGQGYPCVCCKSADSKDTCGRQSEVSTVIGLGAYNQALTGKAAQTLRGSGADSDHIPLVVCGFGERYGEESKKEDIHCYDIGDRRSVANESIGISPTLVARMGTGGNNVPCMLLKELTVSSQSQKEECNLADKAGVLSENECTHQKIYILQDTEPVLAATTGEYMVITNNIASTLLSRDYKDAQIVVYREQYKGIENQQETYCSGTLNCMHDQQAVCVAGKVRYIVRRLTPKECQRLQGMPENWTHLHQIKDMSDEDYEFWKEAHKTYSELNGKNYKEKTKKQMIAWYNKLQTDSAEYKAYGNGMALPCVLQPISGLADLGVKTMASLFDGIGGFPLAGALVGIECLWTSEVELFPIAVTKERFM